MVCYSGIMTFQRITKRKEYKHFSFPNELSPLEILYYYFIEFEVIPNPIPQEKIIKIFDNSAHDFMHGLLDTSSFSLIAQTLLGRGDMEVINQQSVGLAGLMTYCSELEEGYDDEIEAVKRVLKIYLDNPDKYFAQVKLGEFDKMFTE